MALIPVNLDEIKEMRPVPLAKYPLTIVSAEEVTSTKGKQQLDVSVSIDDHDDAPNIRHFISLPAEGDDPKAFRFKVLLLKRFCALFKMPLNGSSIDTTAIALALPGKKTVAEVTMDKETDAQGNEKPGGRTFNRIVVPFLADEGSSSSGRVAPPPPKS